jgi:tetratricopeptide (TPR) repeat protein
LAIKIDQKYTVAYNNKGYALYELKDYRNAIFSFNIAIELDKTNPLYYSNIGNALMQLNLFEEALIVYEKGQAFGGKIPNKEEIIFKIKEKNINKINFLTKYLLLKKDSISTQMKILLKDFSLKVMF